jgi:hypothetical protein
MRIAVLIVLLFPPSVQAQVSYPTKRAIMDALKDAEYAFRRFDEVTGRVDFDRWKVPDDLRQTESKALDVTRAEVENAEKTLSRIERSEESLSGVELLAVYQALGSSVGELADLGYNTLNFQDQGSPDIAKASEASGFGEELARVSGTTLVTQAKLFLVLRQQIAAEEQELAPCRTKGR